VSVRKHSRSAEPNIGLLERAYASTIVPRVMGASAKQKKSSFNQSEFRKRVIDFYKAAMDMEDHKMAYCHLAGWCPSEQVKAAHLVPKSLSGEEIAHLFGSDEVVITDPRNGKN
jgi:hypothetical protein